MTAFPHIAADPSVLGGKPCIKGTRISVEVILEWIASGATADEIVKKYPLLTKEAVSEAIRYAAQFTKNEIIVEVKPSA